MSRESLARKLRVLRAERALSLRQVEEMTGLDKHTISSIERAQSRPYDVTLAKLARAYDVGLEELLEEKGSLPKAPAPSSGPREEAEKPSTQIVDVAPSVEGEEGFAPSLLKVDETFDELVAQLRLAGRDGANRLRDRLREEGVGDDDAARVSEQLLLGARA